MTAFNNYFVIIGSNLANNIPPSAKCITEFLPPRQLDSMIFVPTNHLEISSIIKSLDKNTSPGLDEIPTFILKTASNYIAAPLASLINSALSCGYFPDKRKEAKVTPIYKQGDKHLISNYRPISVLNSMSKIFENVIATRLTSFLTSTSYLYDKQFGFRKGHSTAMALVTRTDMIKNAVSNKNIP